MQPQLTLAIPTYNRVGKLKKSLDYAINLTTNKNVEILVSDNASTDGTDEYMKKLRNTYPEILYYRNDENLGFDGNFLNCFNKANGKYVMLLSDDDFLLPGSIDSILKTIERDPIIIHLNTSTLISEEPFKYSSPRMREGDLLEYRDKNDFLRDVGIHITFVSSLIFKTDLVKKIVNKEQYFKTNILQSHIAFETMKNTGIYIINTYNCLAATGNYTVSYDLYRTWIKNFSNLILITGAKCGFDNLMLDSLLHKELKTMILEFVIFFRRTCPNEPLWDKRCVWSYINRYPDLKKYYFLAIYLPRAMLPVLQKGMQIFNISKKIIKIG